MAVLFHHLTPVGRGRVKAAPIPVCLLGVHGRRLINAATALAKKGHPPGMVLGSGKDDQGPAVGTDLESGLGPVHDVGDTPEIDIVKEYDLHQTADHYRPGDEFDRRGNGRSGGAIRNQEVPLTSQGISAASASMTLAFPDDHLVDRQRL
jgi:hypothetical protein